MPTNKDNLPFAKRYGYEPTDIPYQVDNIDEILRTDLWNGFYIFIYSKLQEIEYGKDSFRMLYRILWIHYFKKPIDDFPNRDYDLAEFVRTHIEKAIWYKVYELLEFVFRNIEHSNLYNLEEFTNYLDDKLFENHSGYSIINNRFVPITNETELNEIRKAKDDSEKYGLSGIQQHLNSALDLVSKKPIPDYRNSIKESKSMVEVISRIIEPKENTLGKALNKLEKNKKINLTLKAGFEKLYAYSNNKNGIRHALMEEEIIKSEDAKFFLIACSAFANYLIEKAKQENLLSEDEKDFKSKFHSFLPNLPNLLIHQFTLKTLPQ
jgi:AbiJ N-terminal domain 4